MMKFRFKREYKEHTFTDVEAESLDEAWDKVQKLQDEDWQWQDKGHFTNVELIP